MNERDLDRVMGVWLGGDNEPFVPASEQRQDGSSGHESWRSSFRLDDFHGEPGFRFSLTGGAEVVGPLRSIAALTLGHLDEFGQWLN